VHTRSSAIVTVGSELVEGLRIDTNTAEIARALAPRGLHVAEAVSVGDDVSVLATVLARLAASYDLVITTGGLGPTHDDITRDAASKALGLQLVPDPELVAKLTSVAHLHKHPEAAEQVLRQALVLEGARWIDATIGTAPGLVIETARGVVALLPGPPSEMSPMLHDLLRRYPLVRALPHELGVVGLSESDAQVLVQRALGRYPSVGFTVLAHPGDVRVLLFDEGCGERTLAAAARSAAAALDDRVYTTVGSTLPQSVIASAAKQGLTIAVAESCTGGMVAAALTDVPGSSAVFKGGVVAYADDVKTAQLGVESETLAMHGAVSEQTAAEMAQGVRDRLGVDVAVSVTGIAGPDGGTPDKPVGMVCFGVASPSGVTALTRHFPATSRDATRARATATALDLIRLEVSGAKG
jgi:nicotinamide-nucleotide amidase